MFSYGMSIGVLAVSIVSIAASQLIMKWRLSGIAPVETGQRTRVDYVWAAIGDGWIWLGVCLIGISAVLWYAAMSRLPLTLMMPMAALVAPLVAFSAYLFLREPLSSGQMMAIAMIAVGVAWLGYQQ